MGIDVFVTVHLVHLQIFEDSVIQLDLDGFRSDSVDPNKAV